MKLKIAVALFSVAVTANAFGNGRSCSNADQTLKYSHFSSNGGAHMTSTEVTYNGVTQRTMNYSGPTIEFDVANDQQLDKQVNGGTTVTTFVGLATGKVVSGDQTVPFSEWVVCKDEVQPICYRCP